MHIGDVLENRFVVESLAGSGGMGNVYRASDRSTGDPVAIKVLRADAPKVSQQLDRETAPVTDVGNDAHAQPGHLLRFDREARILRELDDPRVVRHIASGTAPSGEAYLVMEWLEGEDLARRLERGRLGRAESVALWRLGQIKGQFRN